MGTTPLLLQAMPVGSRAIRVEAAGYDDWSASVQVSANQRTRVVAALSRRPEAHEETMARQRLGAPYSATLASDIGELYTGEPKVDAAKLIDEDVALESAGGAFGERR
jgi:hypothetical protein